MKKTTTLHLHLSKEAMESLERLRLLCGHDTIEQTITAALEMYGVRKVQCIFQLTDTGAADH